MKQATNNQRKPSATLSVDLDNLWAYQRSFGIAGWQQAPSFLGVSITRILVLLEQQQLKLTAFVVGHDAEQTENHQALGELANRGNEIGNHSYWHKPTLHTLDEAAIDAELEQAENAINTATGQHPQGFRGPAFCTSANLLNCLAARNYRYDASSFPTSIGPLARAYQHFKSSLTAEEKAAQANLYGGFRNACSSLNPFAWQLQQTRLIELPVTTLPLLRLPIHMTYINFIADRSPALARTYFKLALALCKIRGVSPSLLLHASDFLGHDDDFELHIIPGMRRSAAEKIALLDELLHHCQQHYSLMPLAQFAEQLGNAAALPSLSQQ